MRQELKATASKAIPFMTLQPLLARASCRFVPLMLSCFVLAALVLCAFPACQALPDARPVSLISPDADRVQAALDRWPKPATADALIKRPFFATVHAAGQRVTASGILQYHNPWDFRITAATEMGVILFDARMNWAGVTVLRHMPGLDPFIIETLVTDFSRALQIPKSLDGLAAGNDKMIIQRKLADTHEYTWLFDRASGRLLQTDVELGTFDTLHILYKAYNPQGWPEEIQVTRKARLYDVTFSFTDSNVVRSSPGDIDAMRQ